MSKLSKGAQNRLLGLLYQAGLVEVASRVPAAMKSLYETPYSSNETPLLPPLILDELASLSLKQYPYKQAQIDILESTKAQPLSIIKFACKSDHLSTATFQNLFPIKRERKYTLPPTEGFFVNDDPLAPYLRHNSIFSQTILGPVSLLPVDSASLSLPTNYSLLKDVPEPQRVPPGKENLPFVVVKGRDPATLTSTGFYYLLFPTADHAAVFYQETKHKVANGFKMSSMKFVNEARMQREMNEITAPATHIIPSLREKLQVKYNLNRVLSSLNSGSASGLSGPDTKSFSDVSAKALGQWHKEYSQLLAEARKGAVDYRQLLSASFFNQRSSMVLVRNLPLGMKNSSFRKVLWDYEFEYNLHVVQDYSAEVNVNVLLFASHKCANRFVRNFHGRPWPVNGAGQKKMYDSLACEFL